MDLLIFFLPLSEAGGRFASTTPSTTIGSVSSLSDHAIACRRPLPQRIHRHRASNPRGTSSKVCCLSITVYPRNPMDQLMRTIRLFMKIKYKTTCQSRGLCSLCSRSGKPRGKRGVHGNQSMAHEKKIGFLDAILRNSAFLGLQSVFRSSVDCWRCPRGRCASTLEPNVPRSVEEGHCCCCVQ